MTDKRIKFFAFPESGQWIVQCEDIDICAQGKTVGEALSRFAATYEAERLYTLEKHGVEFAGIGAYRPEKSHD